MLITRTPLRISLFGGGTDFPDYYNTHGGCVLTTAIDKFIYVIIKPRQDKRVRISCTHIQQVDHIRNIKHELIREAMKMTGMPTGVEIVTLGDLPAGTGLGSSSAVTVGLLKAMHVYVGSDASAVAEEACKIERTILKKPIGVQDQYIADYGGFKFMEFFYGGVNIHDADPNRLRDWLMLFATGVTRKSSDILDEQKKNISRNEVMLEQLKSLTHSAVDVLKTGDYDRFGYYLNESWKIKRKLSSRITNKPIEEMYGKAKIAGALGGKITGAGGGGFLLLCVNPEKKGAVRMALDKYQEIPFNFEPTGSKVIFDA